jgi:hypothetical protein
MYFSIGFLFDDAANDVPLNDAADGEEGFEQLLEFLDVDGSTDILVDPLETVR